MIPKDYRLEKRYFEFIKSTDEVITYAHRTGHKQSAEETLIEGFEHRPHFEDSADACGSNLELISRNHFARTKAFGDYTVVIGIGKELFLKYRQKILETYKDYNSRTDKPISLDSIRDAVQNFLAEEPSVNEQEVETHYLPLQFVKGYFNDKTGELVRNPGYNPNYDCEEFEENIRREAEFRKRQIAESNS